MASLLDALEVIPQDGDEDPEDIFAAAPGLIFPDDTRNMHGDPNSTIFYKSSRFGRLEVRTADPEGEGERRLFAHYLWNAGIKMAQLISEENSPWSVKDQKVLELGAGVGIDGMVAVLAGASLVVISDFPAEAILRNLQQNIQRNIPYALRSRYSVEGYKWGDVDSKFAQNNHAQFTRIIAADCFWMPQEHKALVESMLHFLDISSGAKVFAIAGFHTGRANLVAFFQEAKSQGLVIADIYEEDVDGQRRDWTEEMKGGTENVTERKRCEQQRLMTVLHVKKS